MLTQLGMDTVGANNDVSFGNNPVSKRDARDFIGRVTTQKATARVYHVRRQPFAQICDKVGAVHAEGTVPPRGVCHLHRGDGTAIVTEIMRPCADQSTPSLYLGTESKPS